MSSNNIGSILWNLPQKIKSLFRKFEYKYKKLINKEWSYKFNEIMLNNQEIFILKMTSKFQS